MRRWHISKEWYIVWAFTLIIGGLILYVGYLSANSDISIENPNRNVKDSIQAVTTVPPQIKVDGNSRTERDSKEESKVTAPPKNIESDLKLVFGNGNLKETSKPKDFPSPVHTKPVRGIGNYYSEAFDDYVFHAGLDYALKEGTVIRATHGGKVIYAGEDPMLGNKITLDCGEGWLVTYGGLDNLRIKEGDTIDEKMALGQIGYFPGGEGESNQSQLHYEVWHNGEIQNVEP